MLKLTILTSLFLLSCKFKNAFGIFCAYYPFQPTDYTTYYTICSDYCCSGYPSLSYDACCFYTTEAPPYDYTSTSLWWIALIVVGVVVIAVSVGVTCACIQQQKKKRRLIQPTFSTDPRPQINIIPPAAPQMENDSNQYPITISNYPNYSSPPPPYPMNRGATFATITNEVINISDAPRYESAAGNEGLPTMPVLPATIKLAPINYKY